MKHGESFPHELVAQFPESTWATIWFAPVQIIENVVFCPKQNVKNGSEFGAVVVEPVLTEDYEIGQLCGGN